MKQSTRAFALWVAALAVMSVGLRPTATLLARATSTDHWVATWAAAPQQPFTGQRAGRAGTPPVGTPAASGAPPATSPPGGAPPSGNPATSPPAAAPPTTQPPATAAPTAPPPAPPAAVGGYSDQTLRMFVRASLGGRRVRVQFSNAFGATPLVIGAAHIALHGAESAIVAGSDRTLLFGGKRSIRIPPGASGVTDPVDLEVQPLGELAISVYVPAETGPATRHAMALRTAYIASGNLTGEMQLSAGTTTNAWFFISSVDVLAPEKSETIVAFGDSITDGATSTPNTNRSWPSVLAERLQANKATKHLSIVNLGISGNRILSDGAGVSALARFDRDVLSQAGVAWVMILEGINDINLSRTNPAAAVTADDLIGAMKQMIERAHTHAINVIGCTLTPAGAGTGEVEAMRTAVNDWIRKGGAFDAVVDFDAAVRDPAAPTQFRKEFNNGDRLHPNDAGYKAMADAVELKIFTKK